MFITITKTCSQSKDWEKKSGFSKYRHGGKLRDNIKIKMSVKWITYILNELCDYLSQRKINR